MKKYSCTLCEGQCKKYRNRLFHVIMQEKFEQAAEELYENEQNRDAALEVFKLNIELYPNSANCYDSLAECYWKIGELNLAIKNYERVLAMDPAGPTGANATRMLRQVRAQAQSSSQKFPTQR